MRPLVLLLLAAIPCSAAPSIVNSCTNGNLGANSSCTIATTHAGNILIAMDFQYSSGGGAIAPSDTFALTWQGTCGVSMTRSPGVFNWQMSYANLGAHSGSVTITQSSSGFSGSSMAVMEVNGLSGTLDTCAATSSPTAMSVGPALSPTITTTQVNDFVLSFGWVFNGSTGETLTGGTGGYTVNINFTYGSPTAAHAIQNQVVGAPGPYSATWTIPSSGWWGSMIAAFFAPPSGGSPSQRRQPKLF